MHNWHNASPYDTQTSQQLPSLFQSEVSIPAVRVPACRPFAWGAQELPTPLGSGREMYQI